MFAILKNFKPGPVLPVYGLIIILVLLLMPQYVFASDSRTGDTRELLRKTVENFVAGQEIKIADETLFARVMLPRFYLEREYYPAWIGSKGIGRDAYELIDEIKKADLQGLNPKDYHLDTIVTKINSLSNSAGPSSAGGLAEIDLLLTDAYLIYASHLLSGRVNPETLDPEWQANRRERDMAAWLREALEKHKIAASLYELLPLHRCYGSLLKALIVHRQIAEAGGWPEVPGVSVDLGGSAPEVKILRQRLAASGDLPEKQAGAPELFDSELKNALIHFQARHGLPPTGKPDEKTLAALNVPVERRLGQIILNMERWRWLPQDLGQNHVMVNIADFHLHVFENDKVVLDMPVVVGKTYRRTPVFSDRIRYLVLNPYWEVPSSIARRDILKLAKKDPEYLSRNKFRIYDGWGADPREIDPKTVDWKNIDAKTLKFRFRQDPAPQNALGQAKFMFPNKFNVYIHGTPKKELFIEKVRAFSSGCIRCEYPLDLAEYLLRGVPGWDRQAIEAAIASGKDKTVSLPEPFPVHIFYCTSWTDEDGTINFRNDIYGRDAKLEAAFYANPPSTQ